MTKEDLKQLQNLPLERKILATQAKIIEWYNYFGGQVYVSFSGGKDSTVLLHIARQIFSDIEAVFVDTGLEYPEIRDFVKSKENVTWLKPQMRFDEVIKKYGYPVISKEVSKIVYGARHSKYKSQNYINRLDGLNKDFTECAYKSQYKKYKFLLNAPFELSNRCCNYMKEIPARNFEKISGKKPILGTMANESKQRKSGWLKTGCNAFGSKLQISKPMSFWTEQDVLNYIKLYNIPYCSVYGDIIEDKGKLKTTKLNRTGCMFCMFGVHLEKSPNRFEQLKETHPKMYDYCIRAVENNGLGIGRVLDYINVKY